MMRSWFGLVLLILLCQGAGALGALTTETGSSSWYGELEKPWFQPPGWLFGPVWITLYTLMGIAAWLVIRRGVNAHVTRVAMILFGIQLVLNAIWTPIFFGAHMITLALVILCLLWVAILGTIVAFRRVDHSAGFLLVPYLVWVTFATMLNAGIVTLN